jgi:hypothetical protein
MPVLARDSLRSELGSEVRQYVGANTVDKVTGDGNLLGVALFISSNSVCRRVSAAFGDQLARACSREIAALWREGSSLSGQDDAPPPLQLAEER